MAILKGQEGEGGEQPNSCEARRRDGGWPGDKKENEKAPFSRRGNVQRHDTSMYVCDHAMG